MKMQTKVKSLISILIVGAALVITFLPSLPMNLGLDLQGGSQIILEAKSTGSAKADNDAVMGVLEVIRNRIDSLGVSEPLIQRKGSQQIIVQLPGVKNPEQAIKVIGDTALLEFVEAEWAPENMESLTEDKVKLLLGDTGELQSLINKDPISGKILSERPIILKKVVLSGSDLKAASPGTNQYGEPVVNIKFSKEGAEKFYEVTKRNIGKPLAITLDKRVISAPNINEAIAGGEAQISGHFSIEEMKTLTIQLKAGSLPTPVEMVSNKIIGPTLGKDSISKSKIAGIIGLGLVIIFMTAVYKIPGIIASGALIAYTFICFASLKLFGATLTLPGIAGFILTIGMAVDANVIIFERIKEEVARGDSEKKAIQNGFSRAFTAILDSNVTTLISSVVLFLLGSGTIKGFAVTLSLGVIVSMFSAIFLTRLLLDLLSSKQLFKVKK